MERVVTAFGSCRLYTSIVMAEGFICSRFRRPTESYPVVQQQEEPAVRLGQQTADNGRYSQDYELPRPQETGSEKRTLNIRLLSEAISSLVLLPVSSLFNNIVLAGYG